MPRHYHREGEDLQLESRLLARLEKKKDKLDLHRPLSPTIARRLHEDLRIRLTYHSNAIEGNTLTLRETQVVIEEGITIGGHSLREHLEATNHAGELPQNRVKSRHALRMFWGAYHPFALDTSHANSWSRPRFVVPAQMPKSNAYLCLKYVAEQ